jgi:hypothetical protein
MSTNDNKIKELLKVIESKKEILGTKPRAAWKTNGILKRVNQPHVNINTVNELDSCVDLVAELLQSKFHREESSKVLGVPFIPVTWNGDSLEDWFHDLKLRASMITWDLEKKKLNTLETKLSDLRSEDAKTEDALTGIMQELN